MVAASTLYGGTYTQFDVSFRRLGINTIFVDSDDPENFRRAITKKTKVLYAETIANPRMNVLDIAAVAKIAGTPRAFPFFRQTTFRKVRTDRFPYTVYFAEYTAGIWIAAVRRDGRNDSWLTREPPD